MRQNIICADGNDLCLFCYVGEILEDEESCKFDNQKTKDGCPGFVCNEQCRYCPEDCEFLGQLPGKEK